MELMERLYYVGDHEGYGLVGFICSLIASSHSNTAQAETYRKTQIPRHDTPHRHRNRTYLSPLPNRLRIPKSYMARACMLLR
jgi:hypothetical protein